MPDPAGHQRRENEPCDEGDAPAFVVVAEIEKAAEYAADAGDPAGQQHQQDGGQADQAATDRRRERGKILHEATPQLAGARSPMPPAVSIIDVSRAAAMRCQPRSPKTVPW